MAGTSQALSLRFRAAVEVGDVTKGTSPHDERDLTTNETLVGDLGQPALRWPVMHQRTAL